MYLNTFTPLREPIQYELIFFKWIEMTNKYANVDITPYMNCGTRANWVDPVFSKVVGSGDSTASSTHAFDTWRFVGFFLVMFIEVKRWSALCFNCFCCLRRNILNSWAWRTRLKTSSEACWSLIRVLVEEISLYLSRSWLGTSLCHFDLGQSSCEFKWEYIGMLPDDAYVSANDFNVCWAINELVILCVWTHFCCLTLWASPG